jgi:hypothetical protein
MTPDPILRHLADHNPVREAPAYDDVAEAGLRELLNTVRSGSARPVRHRPRGTLLVLATATLGVAVVLAGIAGIAVLNRPSNDPRAVTAAAPPPRSTSTSPSEPAPSAQRFPTADASTPVELVVDRSALALTGVQDYILQGTETQTLPTGATNVSVTWDDQGDPKNFRAMVGDTAANPQVDNATFDDNGTLLNRTIDYRSHQYTDGPATAIVPADVQSQAAVIAGDLKSGLDTVLGTSVINGRTELHLANHEPSFNREIWVDPTTYLPVRMTAHGSFGSYVIDYVWIPRTDQDVRATFQPPIPSGFTKVTRLGGS